MTRFLSYALEGLENGGMNRDTDRLFAYHHATKHTYQSVRRNAHTLDWKNQPNPFRIYDGAPVVALPGEPDFPITGAFATIAALAGQREKLRAGLEIGEGSAHQTIPEQDLIYDVNLVSRLLWHSMAVSAWKKVGNTGIRYSLRVNPSSGNLHPTETYLALTGFAGLDDGFYHYRPDRHALELLGTGSWTQHLASELEIPWAAESPLIVALTSIFWREAWKYRNRAYRYCCHDLGHAMMSVLLAARALGLSGGAITHFCDARLTRDLGLAGEDEAPMAFLVFPAKNSGGRIPSASATAREFTGIPNTLSADEIPYDLLLGMHISTVLTDPIGLAPSELVHRISSSDAGSLEKQSPPDPAHDDPLGLTVRRRRSALDFDAKTSLMRREDLEQLLDFATRDWTADWRGNFGEFAAQAEKGADFVTLYLYIHRVKDCEPGVYHWEKSSRRLEQLHRANVERVAAFLSLEQPLAGNSCFTISMIANLDGAARVFGNRGYRYVHFEAGAIGQRLYVGAETLGWNATGIGAFYDDDVHRYLGFLEEGESPLDVTLQAAERAAMVMLGSPASRDAAAQNSAIRAAASVISESGEEGPPHLDLVPGELHGDAGVAIPRRDPRTLPQQVIYHFAVGRAVPDPRIEA
jgi:SagB-type dehydrogenase family enzyme